MKNFTLTFNNNTGDEVVQMLLQERNVADAKAHANRCLGNGYVLVTIVEN